MADKIRRYKKEFNYSYAVGVFPTIELLTHRPEVVRRVLLSSAGQANRGVERIIGLCQERGIAVETSNSAMAKLGVAENAYAVGVFGKYQEQLNPAANHLVLVRPSDPGNLGTIIRTMVGFGVTDLAVIRPATDVFDPKAVRASMGAVFQARFQYFESFEIYQQTFSHHLYPFMTDGKVDLVEATFAKPYSLIFGNESAGLDASFQKIGASISIRQSPGIDSLNLAAAVAIGLYAAFIGSHKLL